MARQGNGILVLGGLAALGFFLYEKFLKPGAAEFTTSESATRLRVTIPGVKLTGQDLEFKMFVQNPNSQALVIKSIVGEVYMLLNNGTNGANRLHVGNVAHYGTDVIKPNNQTGIDLVVQLKLLQAVSYVTQILSGKVNNQALYFTGTINANGKPWDITEKMQLS